MRPSSSSTVARDVFAGPTDFAYLPRSIEPTSRSHSHRGGRFALTGARTDVRDCPFRYGPAGPGPRRAPRRRAVQSPSAQLRHPRRRTPAGKDHHLRGDHPGGQLVVLPGAQARRGDRGPRPSSRRSTTSRSRPARTASRASASTARPPRRATRSTSWKRSTTATPSSFPHGWHGPCVAAPGLRHVLPERDGRARGRPCLADLGPSRPGLDP